MKKYTENLDGSVNWLLIEGDAQHSGFIKKGQTRKDYTNASGESLKVPVIVDTWQEMLDQVAAGEITIEWISDTEKALVKSEKEIASIKAEVDRLINQKAMSLGYKSIDAIGKYAGRTGPFSAQCDALALWVDDCYVTCFAFQADIENGDADLPQIEDVAALLPEFIDPGVTI